MLKPLARLAAVLLALISYPVLGAEIILPQDRTAFYPQEQIEVGVSGLDKGAKATVELTPKEAGASPLVFEVTGDGGAVTSVLPPYTLAPGKYTLKLDGKAVPDFEFTIASGVFNSRMLVSQTISKPETGGGNFVVSNMAGTGLLRNGMPSLELRNGPVVPHSYRAFDQAQAQNMPLNIYMYWTGYVTHKPWGSKKSWENQQMGEMMRLFNFRAAQVMRRYDANIDVVGTLDEPGLNWGKNPNGVWVPFVANPDSEPWYTSRGVKFTLDPAGGSDADWMKYVDVRAAVIGEHQAQAREDLQSIWPTASFATDIYAPQALNDGADQMNQVPNMIPCTHVFLDWGVPRSHAASELYIEKCHDPVAPVAHAMNGRLFGEAISTQQSIVTYHVMMNSMLQAGLRSNWWLNPSDMKPEDLAVVNEVAARMGSMFIFFKPTRHDVAVLWSRTELGMRNKDIVAKQAKMKEGGEPIKLMIAALPENTAVKEGQVDANPYNIGGNYRNQIGHAHASLMRSGYAAHIVHEKVLAKKLKDYKVLVIIGQTFAMPEAEMKAISDWQAAGGQVVVDKTTTVKFENAVVTDADFKDIGYKWGVLYPENDKVKKNPDGTYENKSSFKTVREASKYQTNWFMGEFARQATPGMKAAMAKTKAQAILETDNVNLMAARHVSGEAALYMVLNANDVLPDIDENKKYPLYNYAPLKATFTLKNLPLRSEVWCIEGIDWKKVSRVKDASKAITADFAAGEMKLYLAIPTDAKLTADAEAKDNRLTVRAFASMKKTPLPLTVTVTDDAGKELFKVYRSLDTEGRYEESFPVGSNAKAGKFNIVISSMLGDTKAAAEFKPQAAAPAPIAGDVRVFDEKAIAQYLGKADRGPITIVTSGDNYKAAAEQLAKDLQAAGVKATVADESGIMTKVAYPRLWNPYVNVVKAEGEQKKPSDEVKAKVTIQTGDNGLEAVDEAGKAVDDWRKPQTQITVGPKGALVWQNLDDETLYEAGCVLYVNKSGGVETLKGGKPQEVTITEEFKAKWAKPWDKLTVYFGGYQLPPELPHAYSVKGDLILLGDSSKGKLVAALQASELLLQVADAKYPGPGKSLIQMAWSPFALEQNVLFIGASDEAGLKAGIARLVEMAKKK